MISIRLRGIQNYSDMKRYGSVIRVRPEKLEEYKKLHAEVWPGVRRMIAECGLRNYSIYYKDGFLFSYYEYVGDDYAADMAKMAADPETQRWWAVCRTVPATARHSRRRRVVGLDGRGIPPRLNTGQRVSAL